MFDGLLATAGHNDMVLDLIFDFAVWHAYAKLRLHSDTTLTLFDDSLRSLGFFLRLFKSKVCPAYATRELPSEEAARTRQGRSERRIREFSLNTYKIHSMGHYSPSVRELGTFENSSTQLVCQLSCGISFTMLIATQGESEHRRAKRFYAFTNKRDVEGQIAKQEARTRFAHETAPHDNVQSASSYNESSKTPVDRHHHMPDSQKHHFDLRRWFTEHANDPAKKVSDSYPLGSVSFQTLNSSQLGFLWSPTGPCSS